MKCQDLSLVTEVVTILTVIVIPENCFLNLIVVETIDSVRAGIVTNLMMNFPELVIVSGTFFIINY